MILRPSRNWIGLPMESIAKKVLGNVEHHFYLHADAISNGTFVELCIYIIKFCRQNFVVNCHYEIADEKLNEFIGNYYEYQDVPFRDIDGKVLKAIYNDFIEIYRMVSGDEFTHTIDEEIDELS